MKDKYLKALHRYRISNGKNFRLRDFDPGDTNGFDCKDAAAELLAEGVERLSALQEILYAQDRWSLLLIFQAMDAAGKDSVIKHVMSGINPQGVEVSAFKAPSDEELDHNFLWRCAKQMPQRGRIGIFNRSYYEEVLVVRVHPRLLDGQKLPRELVTKNIWKERFEDINTFERHATRSGTVVRKFFLHVSKEEQRRRFLNRLDEPAKNWKFSMSDIEERGRWQDYMRAYEEMIRHTSTPEAPWYIVPADHKWFTRLVVAAAAITALEEMKLSVPKLSSAKRRELDRVRRALAGGKAR